VKTSPIRRHTLSSPDVTVTPVECEYTSFGECVLQKNANDLVGLAKKT